MVADMTGNGRQGIALINQLQRVGIALFAHQTDIFRDILLNSAGGNAWCDVAVGEGQFLADINMVIGFPVFWVYAILTAFSASAFNRVTSTWVIFQPSDCSSSRIHSLPQVASRLQQVRRHRDRMNPRGKISRILSWLAPPE